jgi:GTPase SAR1 family protein
MYKKSSSSKKESHSTPQSVQQEIVQIFKRFSNTRHLSEPNEAETRAELIDVILSALGWESGGFAREVHTGTGDYVDYELARHDPTIVIEAKRTGKAFLLDEASLTSSIIRSINSLWSNGGKHLRETLKQAATYCNDRGIPYACITNGHQWLFFRGLSTESFKWKDGKIVIFSSPESIITNFDTFLGCLAPFKVKTSYLHRLLSRPTSHELPAAIIPEHRLRIRHKNLTDSQTDIRRIIGEKFFGRIHGGDRPEMLEGCYIEPGGRPDFHHTLRRLLDDTVSSEIRSDENITVFDGSSKDFINRVKSLELSSSIRYPILVVGNVGVGKTTFLYRTLLNLRESGENDSIQSESAIFSYTEYENQGNIENFDERNIQEEVAEQILKNLRDTAVRILKKRDDISENSKEEVDCDSSKTMHTMMRNDLDKEKNLGGHFKNNPEKWEERKYEIFKEYRQKKVDFLIHYIKHLRARFKRKDGSRYPILIIVDNIDQASSQYQKCVYGLALRLAKETPAVVIISVREDTYSEGRQPKGFLSASPLEFVFHVQAPPLDSLLRQRIKYMDLSIDNNIIPKGLRNAITDIQEIKNIVAKGLLGGRRESLEVLSALSGHDTRSSLRIVREYILGASVVESSLTSSVEFLLESLIVTNNLKHQLSLKKLFDADPHIIPLHWLRLRLLSYYNWAYEQQADRNLLEDTELVIGKFSAWGYPSYAIEQALEDLCKQELLNPIHENSSERLPPRITISPSGYAHITRLASQPVYRTVMALICRWYDTELVHRFIEEAEHSGTDDGVSLSDIVLANTVSIFDAYLSAAKSREDKALSHSFNSKIWVQEVLSRSHIIEGQAIKIDLLQGKINDGEDSNNNQQLLLDVLSKKELMRLSRNEKLHGTVWTLRVLWALEFARVNNYGAITAAKIAAILTEEADMDIPAPNVSRAFREDFTRHPEVKVYFARSGKKYSITEEGTKILNSFLRDEYSDMVD